MLILKFTNNIFTNYIRRMVQFCCAFNCSKSSDTNPELIFHSFPNAEKDKERRQKWIHAIRRKNWQPGKYTRLCSEHFLASDYDPPVVCGKLRLKSTAIPSVFDYPEHLQPKKVSERRPLIRLAANLVEPDIDHSMKPQTQTHSITARDEECTSTFLQLNEIGD
ncbi:THAP domain-containing protein 2-like [Planococcus citri]|uniref:THAP domain-containing protein 2-like n=1 Tax=Planococcus citri TaxID=170843 RepID=UPI0031FA0769